MTEALRDLLETENQHLQKLNDIVRMAIEDEKLISKKGFEFEDLQPSFKGKLADIIAAFGGSWLFIILFVFIMAAWIITNIYLLSKPFDPFPFILLNLILSTLAALQAPIIMMSQNRKEEKDRQRAISDYLVNLKAEIEVRHLHEKLDLLMAEQMKTLFHIQQVQMEVLDEIKEILNANRHFYINDEMA